MNEIKFLFYYQKQLKYKYVKVLTCQICRINSTIQLKEILLILTIVIIVNLIKNQ